MTPRERYKTAVEAMAEAAWNNDPSHTPVPWCLAKDRRKDAYRRDARQQLDALLAAMPGLGLKVVPVEATAKMMREFWLAGPFPAKPWKDGYAAMLAAAPDPLGGGE